jgi:hypothetical protein
MSDLDRQLHERLQRADLPAAPHDLHVALESVVRTPVERSDGRDRLRPLRLLAIAAVIVTAGLAVLVVGGGLPRNTAIIPNPRPTPPIPTPQSTPSTVPTMSAVELAGLANLPDAIASTCIDTNGGIKGLPVVGTAIRCSENGVTVELVGVAGVADSGDPLTAGDVWSRLAYQPTNSSLDEQWIRSDVSMCSSQARASYSNYAVGTRPIGRIGGCTDEGWLIWTIDRLGIVGRIEPASGSLADSVAWFRTNRPVGGLTGLIWEVPWFACNDEVPDPGCDGPLPAETFDTIATLARTASWDQLQALSHEATDTSEPELVRLTGRVAFGFVEDGWIGVEVRRISGSSWDQPVMIPEVYLVGPQNGDIIDVVGWVGEQFGMPEDTEPPLVAQPSPAYALPAFLPHVDVVAYRPAD